MIDYSKKLTLRQKRVRTLREKGWTMQKIADAMGISKQRVHQHLQVIAKKLSL